MSEEKFEAWLQENADEYHRPPDDIPRDEMWDTIVRARQAQQPQIRERSLVAGGGSLTNGRRSLVAGRWQSPPRC